MKRSLPADDMLYSGGSEELQRKIQTKFIRFFRSLPGKVLEIGCSRGVVLSLMKEEGIEAYGIDLSETAIEYCVSKGLDAHHSDVLSHLHQVPDMSLGGIFCAHVIEHLSPNDVIELINQAFRVLKPGGKLLLITPNAKDLRTAERFWLDITHVRLYPNKLLRVLLQREGFHNIRTFADKEPANNIFVHIIKIMVRLWFLGFMFVGDLVVIGER